ncbi:MAG TPA: rod shape-determining protein MreD [Steroidobacteraceae bacterium]|nr:rod shape-determining protein MreD [Steroidobacteraceae bacterium]
MSSRENLLVILSTSFVALVLNIWPLPVWLSVIRPAFLVLAVLYWSTMQPFVAGMALGFLGGLALDVFQGSLLGEHALALSLLTYLALRLNLLMRAKPIFEQSVYVLLALLVYESLLWVIDGWTGHATSSALRWIHVLTGALLWPLVVGVLGRFHSQR